MAKASAAVQKRDSSKVPAVQEAAIESLENRLPVGYLGANDSLAVALSRAEVDQQITTAKAYPRDVALSVKRITDLALLDEETAEECIYALPRGDTPIRGPSIRLAEIIASQWGNNHSGARPLIINRDEKYVEAEGKFHDFETNVATTARTRRPIKDRLGRIYNDDMITMTANAAAAIAKRNAILAGVPKAVWRTAYNAVELHLSSGVKTLVERRAKAIKSFHTFGVKPEELCALLKISKIEEITGDHLNTLQGYYNAIKAGEIQVEKLFPKKGAQSAATEGQEKTPAEQATQAGADPKTGELPKAEDPPKAIDPTSPHSRGRQARRENRPYHSIPADLIGDPEKADAYQAGWSFEDDEIVQSKKAGKP